MRKPIPFGKYYLLERINVGGMAEVFRAKAYGVEGFERLVAVKRILPNIAEDKDFIRMFIDEAKIAVQLNHANIAQIFDLGVVDASYYIALEHVHGRDLRAIFDRCRHGGEPMPIAQACFVMMKVCEGLDYAHNKRDQSGRELNLVHRDVSPQNVLVSFEGEVKLIDFGIAKAAGKGSKTQAGILKGKFGYMSPEQVRGLPIDRRSDVFACGIVLYELLTGERLFVGESDFSTLEKVRNVEILPPSTYNRKIPDELERIVLKALAKDVEDRYQNAIDLHDELQAFVYTAGEFYSRKDLASWMKSVFVREIEEETAKLEGYRHLAPMAPPERGGARARAASVPPAPPRRTLAMPSVAPPNGTSPPPVPPGRRSGQMQAVAAGAAEPAAQARGPGLEWDEDELETSIYPDKDEGATAGVPGGDKRAGSPAHEAGAGAGGAAASSGQLLATARPHSSEPDLGTLASTSRGWPPPGESTRTTGQRRAASLADGSSPSSSPFTGDSTVDERRSSATLQGTGDPSAVVELASLAQARAERLYGDPSITDSGTFGSSFLAAHRDPTGSRFPLKLVGLIAGGVVVAAAAVLVVFFALHNRGGTSQAKVGPAPATQTVAATQAGHPAAAPVVDPNTGFDLIVDPAGVDVKLDGRPIGKAPLQIRNMTEGDHVVQIEAPPGFFNKTETVKVKRGEADRVTLKLDAMDVVGKFTSEPSGAKVTLLIDGQKVPLGSTPVDAKLDPRRRYEAVFHKSGYMPATRVVEMTGAAEVPVSAVLDRGGHGQSAVAQITHHQPDPATDVVPERTSHHASHGKSGSGGTRVALASSDSQKSGGDPAGDDSDGDSGADDGASSGAGQGTLGLMAKPPCRIFIDGRDTGQKTPQVGISLKVGRHRVTLINNEFGLKESFVVKIKAGEATKAIKDLTDRLPPQ